MVFIDHYDSFSANLIAWLEEHPACPPIEHVPYDYARDLLPRVGSRRAVVLSPGPKNPAAATSTCQLVATLLGKVPILGVCLGHQILGTLAGGQVIPSQDPRHGRTKEIFLTEASDLFAGYDLGVGLNFAAYHSLIVDTTKSPLAVGWKITARCGQGEIQALEYQRPGAAPAFGVQFHPESFLSGETADRLRENWIARVLAPRS